MLDVKVTGDLDAWARSAANAALAATRAEVQATVQGVYSDAKSLWPVRRPDRPAPHPRGYSKSRLAQTMGVEDETVIGRIKNDAGYAYQIKSRNVELPPGSQYEAAWGGKMLALLNRQEQLIQSGRMFRATQSGKQSMLSSAYRKNQRAIKQQAARARDARHVWTALVREPAERKSVGLRDRLKEAIVRAIEGVR